MNLSPVAILERDIVRRSALLLATILLVAACSDSAGPSGEANISGTYALQTVNGQNLPVPVVATGTDFRLEVLSGSLTVNGNGTFISQLTWRETEAGTVETQTQSTTGTWTRSNNAVALRANPDGSTLNGSISGKTITFVEEGVTFVFRK